MSSSDRLNQAFLALARPTALLPRS